MKTKTLILTIFFLYAFANVCDAQLNLGDLISKGVTVGKAIKKAKKMQKELRDNPASNVTVNENQNENQNENNDSITGTARNIETTEMSFPTKNTIANPKDEVALTVSADGATKEEATKIALRSAVEQAYGAFVSANTTILNDEIVKDEIITISNGNIKSYQEVASVLLPNGRTTVTLNAIVSISKLTSYAQSKGATTEFAGATFAMNVKMRELNKINEMKALDNLIIQIKALLPVALERELVLYEPELYSGKSLFAYFYDNKQLNPDNYFIFKLGIKYKSNENTESLGNLIYSTLKSLEPSEEEYEYFKTRAHATYSIARLTKDNEVLERIRTRLSRKEFEDYDSKMNKVLIDYMTDFEIIDNTGTISSFNASLWGEYFAICDLISPYSVEKKREMKAIAKKEEMYPRQYHGTGIFNPVVELVDEYEIQTFFRALYWHECKLHGFDNGSIQWDFAVLIPKADIAKYTQFTIRSKTKK